MFFLPVVDTLEVMSVITSVMFGTVLENDGLESAGLESAIVIADFVPNRVASSQRGFAENKNEKLLQYCFNF